MQGILRAFDQSGVRVVPLKGPLLAERLYGGAELACCRDLDILVSKADFSRAEAVLTAAGFAPGAPDDYQRPWDRRTTTVELHYDAENPLAFNFLVEGAMRNFRPASFRGQHCWLLAPEDELLFLCLPRGTSPLRTPQSGPRCSARVRETDKYGKGVEPSAGGGRTGQSACPWTGDDAPSATRFRRVFSPSNFAAKNRHLQEDCNRLLAWRRSPAAEPLDWRAERMHFSWRLELPGWPRFHRRIRHLRILASRVIAPDYAFAARFGLRRAWQVRMLRPLRLLVQSTLGAKTLRGSATCFREELRVNLKFWGAVASPEIEVRNT